MKDEINRGSEATNMKSFDIWDGSIAEEFAGGKGTETEPYLISTASQLAYLQQLANSNKLGLFVRKYYELTADLDLAGIEWVPINASETYSSICLDGRNHSIRGLTIHSEKSWQGLFGSIKYKSYIKNLKVVDAYVSGNSWVGGIVGDMTGDIENCHFSGEIKAGYTYIGGIAGRLTNGTITGCSNSSTISGSNILSTCGGIVGSVSTGSITYCQNEGKLTCYASTGGIAGNAKDIRYCSNIGTVSGTSNSIGGIVGIGKVITGCVNTGSIIGKASTVGGIAGEAELVTHSLNIAEIKGSLNLGGILGRQSYYVDSTIESCYNSGKITGSNYIGGVIPFSSGSKMLYIKDCYNQGMVDAKNYKGALLGYVYSGKKPIITNSYYLQGSAEQGIGRGDAEYEELVIEILKPQPVLELLSKTIKFLIEDSNNIILTWGKGMMATLIKTVESFYKNMEKLGSGNIDCELYSVQRTSDVTDFLGGKAIATLSEGDEVKVVLPIETQPALGESWIKIYYDNRYCWIAEPDLKKLENGIYEFYKLKADTIFYTNDAGKIGTLLKGETVKVWKGREWEAFDTGSELGVIPAVEITYNNTTGLIDKRDLGDKVSESEGAEEDKFLYIVHFPTTIIDLTSELKVEISAGSKVEVVNPMETIDHDIFKYVKIKYGNQFMWIRKHHIIRSEEGVGYAIWITNKQTDYLDLNWVAQGKYNAGQEVKVVLPRTYETSLAGEKITMILHNDIAHWMAAADVNESEGSGSVPKDVLSLMNAPIDSTWGISDSTAEAWFLSTNTAVVQKYGLNSTNIGGVTAAIKAAGVSPVLFYAYTVNEGGGLGGFINHYGGNYYANNGGDTAVNAASGDAQYLANQSKIMNSTLAWYDTDWKRQGFSGPVDFVPQSVKDSGKASFANMPSGSIGRVYLPSTAAATWEVYYPDGLKKSYNQVQNYGDPLQGVLNSIIAMSK